MKNFLIFMAGLIVGLSVAYVLPLAKDTEPVETVEEDNAWTDEELDLPAKEPVCTASALKGVTLFDKRGERMPEESFKIEKTLSDTYGIARGSSYMSSDKSNRLYMGKNVLMVGNENAHFYDEQMIDTKKGMHFYHIGNYKYKESSYSDPVTLPVVKLMKD